MLDKMDNPNNENLHIPKWDVWRRKGACRIWKAVLISMSISPEINVRTLLKQKYPGLYSDYLRRKEEVVANYGLIPEFPSVKHLKAGARPGEQYVLLDKLLIFAKNKGWENLENFEKGMKEGFAGDLDLGKFVNIPEDLLTEEARNGLVRTGAILKLLEDVLLGKNTINTLALLHGSSINISNVAKQVEKIIADNLGQKTVKNFASEANRKYLSRAQNALRSY